MGAAFYDGELAMGLDQKEGPLVLTLWGQGLVAWQGWLGEGRVQVRG